MDGIVVEDCNGYMPKKRRSDWKGGFKVKGSNRNYEFIAWDGEGVAIDEPTTYHTRGLTLNEHGNVVQGYKPRPQPYVLLANSKGERIINEDGLRSVDVFNFLLDTKEKYPRSIFVGFYINYDINQWFKDVPLEKMKQLVENSGGRLFRLGRYQVRWRPGKSFLIREPRTGRSCIIYDVSGFFQTSFLNACREYLGSDDPDLAIIEKGKDARSLFSFDELDEFIIPYNDTELKMLVKMMNMVRQDFAAIDIHPGEWYGPGVVAAKVLKKWNIQVEHDLPKEILDASQYAYAGGRFEQFGVGRYVGPVFQYDIRSAYPSAAIRLPDLSTGTWEHVKRFEPGSFGVFRLDYRDNLWKEKCEESHRPQPLFCRSEDGRIGFPHEVQGWFWEPEAGLCPDNVTEGWIYRPLGEGRPLAALQEMYDQRRIFKAEGNSSQRALKLILNSVYGKFAQQVGSKNGKPPYWHQLEYAGYITSYTRAKICRAIQLNPDAIIATETDSICSREPLDLPLSTNLGDWELERYNEIVYLQSGFYYAIKEDGTVVCRFRGMDRDRKRNEPVGLPYWKVLDHLRNRTGKRGRCPFTPPLLATTTRFVGIGVALNTDAVWRSWETRPHRIDLDQNGGIAKRYHLIETCPNCQNGETMYDSIHPMRIGGWWGGSYPTKISWRELEGAVPTVNEYYAQQLAEFERDRWS